MYFVLNLYISLTYKLITNIMTLAELKQENKSLLTLSGKLLKQCNKMIKSDVNGAKLLFNRIEEINNKRQENNTKIIALCS